MSSWFGSTWPTIGWVVASTAAVYVVAVVCVRLGGRRTVVQMSAFDAVITVALGSLLATTAVSADTSVAEGSAALATLLVLQVVLAAARRRSPGFRRLVDLAPEVVVDRGEIELPRRLTSSQLTEDELLSRLRASGTATVPETGIVLLEPDGTVSVVRDAHDADAVRRRLGHR